MPPSDVNSKLDAVAEIPLGASIPIVTLLIVAPLVPTIGLVNVETPETLKLSKFVCPSTSKSASKSILPVVVVTPERLS